MYMPTDFDFYNKLNHVKSERECRNIERRKKLQALIDDQASTEGEKEAARKALERINN